MKKFYLIALLLLGSMSYSQVGIGTVTPSTSSALDIQSTTQGLLTPRMSSAERIAISSPANGLLVYDTTLTSFFYYDTPTTTWIKVSGGKDNRLNYKLIRSSDVLANVLAAEKLAGGNSKYLLDSQTLYEINGPINVDLPIEINNAYLIGLDSGEDKLIKASGDLFTGTTGGSIRVLTLQATAGNVFNIISPSPNQSMILRDCIVTSSANVGRIQNFALVFVSIVNYVGNANGIVYENIGRLLLSNAAWFSSNGGKYETLAGTFNLVTKQGGFSEVTGTSIGFDVSANPTITGDAVIESAVFSGALTSGKYVNGYNPAIYTGFNFNNNWSVISPGITTEGDSQSTGTVYLNQSGTTQANTPYPATTGNFKLAITSGLTANLFRTTSGQTNRITYIGKKGRIFQISSGVSFDAVIPNSTSNTEYSFFFMKVSASGANEAQVASETLIDTNAGFIQSFQIQGSVYLNAGDSVELWYKRLNGGGQSFKIRSFSMTIR